MTPEPSLLGTSDVAARCNVEAETVRRWVREGKLAAIVLPGGLLRFRREDVDALLTPVQPPAAAGAA